MKKLLSILTVCVLLLSALSVTALANESGTKLVRSMEPDQRFANATRIDCENYIDGEGIYVNRLMEHGFYGYLFVKYVAPDGSSVDDPHAVIGFEIEQDGTYAFMMEVMAQEGPVPRAGRIQIDDGDIYHIKELHDQGNYVREYYTGIEEELDAGSHTLTIYPAEDFDDTTVKAMFFDCFYFVNTTPVIPAQTDAPEESAAPETAAPAASETNAQATPPADGTIDASTSAEPVTDAQTEAQPDTASAESAPETDAKSASLEETKSGCGSAVSGIAVVLCAVSAAVIFKKRG